MAKDNETKKWLYDAMTNNGYDLGTYDEYLQNSDNEDTRKWLYDNAKEAGLNLGDYNQFSKGMGQQSVDVATEPMDKVAPDVPVLNQGPVERPTLKQLAGDKSSKFAPMEDAGFMQDKKSAEGLLSKEDLGARLQDAFKAGKMEPMRHQEEESRIDAIFKPKEVATDADIFENYRARFSNTERGMELDKERGQIRNEIAGAYMEDFKQSPEYKAVAEKKYNTQEELDAVNSKLGELFNAKYGEAIEKDMRPYDDAMTDEMLARYGQRIDDDMLQLNKKNTKQQVSELSGNVDKLLEDNDKRLKQRGGSGSNAANSLMGSRRYNEESAADRQEKGTLQSAKKLLEQSQNIISEAGKKGNTNFFAGLGRGLYDNTTWDNYTFGLAELADGRNLLTALGKAERGEELTDAEDALLAASAVNMATQAYFSQDLGRGYKAGETTAVSIPFMLEFVANPISSSGNAIAKGLLKYGLKKFGSAATTKGAKIAGRLIGDATAAAGMTATTSAPRVGAGAMERLAGNYTYGLDEEGNMKVEKEGDLTAGSALMKSAASTFFENQSEMIFNAFRPANKMMKAVDQSLPGGVNEFMNRVQHSRIGKLYHDIKTNPTFIEAAKRAQFHGIGEEYLEEVYNNFANVAMGEMTMDELTDLDNNINTFLGLAPTQVMFAAIGLGSLASERYSTRRKLNRLYEQASEEQKARMDELRNMSHENGNDDIARFIQSTLADESLSPEEKRNEIDYAYNLAKGIAMEEVQEDDIQDAIKAETEDILSHTDPSTGIYTEISRLSMDDVGNTISIPGRKYGEINGAPVFIQEGVENKPENRIVLKPEEIDQSSIKSMPADEVVAATEQMVRQEAEAKAEREAKFSPDIEEPAVGISFNSGGNRYEIVQPRQTGASDGTWIVDVYKEGADKPTPIELTNEQYYELRQAEIDAAEAADIIAKQKEDNAKQNEVAAQEAIKAAESVVQPAAEKQEQAKEEPSKVVNGVVMRDDGTPDLPASGAVNALGFLRERYKEEKKVQHKIEKTREYHNKELEKVQKALDKAQEEFDDAPFGMEDKAEAKLQKAQQDFDAVKREVDLWSELYNMLIADRVKESSQALAGIAEMGDPLNGEELAAMMLANSQVHLLREDYLRETGYSNAEANKLFGLFRSKENGGVTVEVAGESVMLADKEKGTHFFDQNDSNAGRNAILEVLSQVHTPSDLRDFIKNNREELARKELEAEREYYEAAIERDYHMSLDDYEAYMERLANENPFADVNEAEIDAIFAEAEEAYQEYLLKQQEDEQGRTNQIAEGGNNVLPAEQSGDAGGTDEGERSRKVEGAGSGIAGENAATQEAEQPVSEEVNPVEEEVAEQPTVQEQVAAAEAETDTDPSEAQKKAGNYKMGHVQIGNFDISIENPAGSERKGVDASGKPWSTKMVNTYGYMRGTEGVDGDHIDVFLANDMDAWNGRKVFVVDQYNEDEIFDEHKVMLGFNEQDEAEAAYFANYEKDWAKKHKTVVTPVNLEDFEKWVDSSHRKTKAFAEYKSIKSVLTDHQGNPVNADGTLLVEKIERIDDITDEDFLNSFRNVQLPTIPQKVADAIGTNGKPVVIKKFIFEKNLRDHKDVTPAQGREILQSALYTPDLYGQNQKVRRPYNWIVINTKDEAGHNRLVLLEVNDNKDNIEIVHWHYLDDRGLEKIRRQAKREDGQLLILPSEATEEVGALSDPTQNLSSENKDNKSVSEKQGAKEQNSENTSPITHRMEGYTIEARKDTRDNSDLYAVKFDERVSRDEFKGQKEIAKQFGGYWSNFGKKGFLFKSEEAAHDFAETVMGRSVEEVESETGNNHWKYSLHMDKVSGRTIINRDDVSGPIPIGDGAWKIEASSPEEMIEILENPKNNMQFLLDEFGAQLKNRIAFKNIEEEEKKAKEEEPKHSEPSYGANNKMVTNEQYEKLKARMKKKLGQLNMGMDPEMIEIGTMMAVYHFEAGARKFTDYAKRMIADCGDNIRPYLKSFYNAIRDYPGIDEDEMTPYEEVRKFDVANFDKETTDVVALADETVKEEIIEKKVKQALKPSEGDKPAAELEGDSAEYQETQKEEKNFVQDIIKGIEDAVINNSVMKMADVKKILKEYARISALPTNDIQELVELALTNLTRRIAQDSSLTDKEKYDNIVSVYKAQPLLNARDSTRVELQQYSTPTPFGFLMGQFLKSGREVKSMLEPSAGNGALTINFDPAIVHVNDIDKRRLSNLRTLGYSQVTNQDALMPFEGDMVDAVATNPPFGSITQKVYDDIFKISSLEGQMAINALDKMKDNGRAAIIIGGNTEYRENGAMKPKDLQFFGYLYSHYNVADVINLDGDMYARNGTKYPVRIILIDGRKTGEFERVYPPVKSKGRAEQVTTFEELYNRINDDILQLQPVGNSTDSSHGTAPAIDGRNSKEDGKTDHPADAGVRTKPVQTSGVLGGETRVDGDGHSGSGDRRTGTDTGGNKSSDGVGNGHGGNAGSSSPVQRRKSGESKNPGMQDLFDGPGRSGGNDAGSVSESPSTGRTRLEVSLTDEKVPYPNRSQSGTLMSVVPANQAQVLSESLAAIGDVDQFLVNELGYANKEELFDKLAAEQIDSVALAINQMNNGNAFIIGDMTGVGKGRQGAALIRYAVKKGKTPIYFTQKPALFSDNYRDLSDIGSGELRPFIMASDKEGIITDAAGKVVHKLPSKKEVKRVLNHVKENGTLPEEYDYVLCTYSQINSGTKEYEVKGGEIVAKDKKKANDSTSRNSQERRDFIEQLSKGNIVVLDESHTVGGDGGGSMFMRYIMPKIGGVTFLSATFAKRADNMPLYAMRTAISASGIKPDEMIDAVARGGVTLQEIMSKQLVQSGQMIRRERNFKGVTIDWLPVSEEADAVQRKQFNEVAEIFSSIRDFQKRFIKPLVDGISEEWADRGGYSDIKKGTEALGVMNTPFASKMYNLVNQLLFALKADAVADRVIYNLQQGFKPVISFSNTMEGFLEEAPKNVLMDEIPNFSLTLVRALDGVMRYQITDADNKKEYGSFKLSDLAPEGQEMYNDILKRIKSMSNGLPISPMDAIRMKLEDAGYKVGEITGRKTQLIKNDNGQYMVVSREDKDKKAATRDFNNGQLDVLMINKSGSTGISLHASPKFGDQRQRVMVFAQFQSDINDEVQMRGRIDRTGQLFRGKYEYLMSSIPAEQRLQMMFKAKLKSLDANTTSSQKSKFNEMEVVDFLNKYGDEVVTAYMLEHPELEEKLGDPLKMFNEGEFVESDSVKVTSDASGKIARHLAFLPVEEQEIIFKEISDAYNMKIQMLNDAGENDLEITTMPLRAKLLNKKLWTAGTDPDSGNAFADNTYLEEVEVDVLKKPMTFEEAHNFAVKLLDGKQWGEYKAEREDQISAIYNANAESMKDKIFKQYAEKAEKARTDFIKKATKSREDGKNELSDDDIAKMAVVAMNDVLDRGVTKAQKVVGSIEARRDSLLEMLKKFTPGQPLVINQELDEDQMMLTLAPSKGMFLGFKFSKDYTLGSSSAVFATLDGRRKVEIPLSKAKVLRNILHQTVMNKYLLEGLSGQNWDKSIPNRTRKKAYIVTGNLMQALVDTKKQSNTKGYLITYSTEDGGTRQGILMPDRFEPKDLRKSVPISTRLPQLRSGEKIESEDGKVTIEKEYGWNAKSDYTLKVPKSSKSGSIYFADTPLRRLVYNNEFETKGNKMVAYIKEDDISKVLDRLSKLGVTVLAESKLKEVKDEEDTLYRDNDLEQVNQRFNEELKRQIDGSLPEGHIYQLGMPSDILLSTGVPNLPIQMSASRLKAKATSYGHDFDLSAIRDIVKSIQSPIAVFAYGNKDKAQNLIIEIRSNGKNFVVGLSLKPVVGGKVLEINSVRNVFPKDTAEWLNWIPQGKALYIDKERIQNLIDQQRTILADVDYLDLDSVTKIVKDFENPSIGSENLYREVTDDSELAWLENQPTVKAYRAMQVIDGRLYSPMASGKKKELGDGYGLNKWDVATEMAFNVTDEMLEEVEKLNQSDKRGYVEVIPGKLRFVKESKGGKASLKYHLVTDETDVWAAYNPYNHNSDSMLNDQFKAAYRRGNIVVVEAEVPVEDLESGYQAPYSKDAVGKTEWKSGDVAAQFPDEMKRTVYLSRYTKPVRVLSNTEVAKWIGDRLRRAEQLTGKPITLYEASFHPEVKRLLEADGFTFVPVEQPKGKVSKVLEGHPDYMNDEKIAALNKELKRNDSWLQRTGEGSYTNEELSYENDPIAKWMGESQRSNREQEEHGKRVRERMAERAQELAKQLHLDNVEIVTDVSSLEGRKARAKGWFSQSTGKIVVVVPNHKSVADVEQTVLHEAVAHYGLRKLFGKHFDDFLDNVFNNAEDGVKQRITEKQKQYYRDYVKEAIKGVSSILEQAEIIANLPKKESDFRRLATEEYLASLAENTNFENAVHQGWFDRIKLFFIRMLAKAGVRLDVELGDNELRYILWRSYENLAEPGRYRGIIEQAADIAKQYELGVGNYANSSSGQQRVAEDLFLREAKSLSDVIDDFTSKYNSAPIEIIHNGISVDELMGMFDVDENEAREMQAEIRQGKVSGGYVPQLKKIVIFADTIRGEFESTLFHENIHAVLDKLYADNSRDIADAYYNATEGRFVRFKKKINKEYPSEEVEEEFFTYALGYSMEDGKFNRIDNFLPASYQPLLEQILKTIGYERESETEIRRRRNGTGNNRKVLDRYREKWAMRLRKNEDVLFEDEEEDENGFLFFRDGDGTGEVVSDGTREDYESAVTGAKYRAQEGFQDSMLALKRLQDVIEKKTGKIKGFENAYMVENQMSSKNTSECEKYGKNFFKPMMDEVVKLINQGTSYEDIIRYLYAKHGLERNKYMRHRAAEEAILKELGPKPEYPSEDDKDFEEKEADYDFWHEEFREKVYFYEMGDNTDYSGLSSLTKDEKNFEEKARLMVSEFEGKFDTDALWKKVNAATKETLRKTYESGLISRDTYEMVSKQYENYIPLRGWDETTADEVYEYMQSELSPLNSTLKTAKGRKSMADDPLATIGNMAESAILQGNRNLMKQNLLNLALNHPTDVLTVREAWYVLDYVTKDWKLSVPDIKEGDSADEIASKVAEHEERMREMKDLGLASKAKNDLRVDYKALKNHQREHMVVVKRNGKDYILYVNGNPRAAQAVNGLTNPNREENKVLAGISRFNRWMAANFTTRNPAFVFSNLSRDLILSVSAVAVKEDGAYTKKFSKNIPSAMRIIARNLAGKGDPNNAEDRMFEEFLANGGETGYTALHNVEEYKKVIKGILKDEAITGKKNRLKKGFKASVSFFSTMNRWAEDVSRFTAYKTSREMGRTVTESVNDAKEITVNFNKKGSGAKAGGLIGAGAWAGRSLYLFFNAAVQSLVNFGRLAKKNRKGFLTLLGGFFTAGFLTPMLNQALMQLFGDDDDDYYNNLPEWVRRNNLCIYTGLFEGKFITIPLPIELRAFYGLGEMAYQELCGNTHNSGRDIAFKAINQISELLPMNPLGNDGDIVSNFMPDVLKPYWQLKQNRDFTGKPIYKATPFNELKPEWTRVYKSTNPALVSLAEWTNELGGGDKHKRSEWNVLNWNPAKVEHVLEGYFGGMAKTINQTGGFLINGVLSAMDGQWSDHFSWASTPVLNRFVSSGNDDRSSYTAINSRYYELQDRYKEIEGILSGYKKEAMKGDTKYREKLNELLRSNDFRIYQIFKQGNREMRALKEIEKMLPESSDEELEQLQNIAAQKRRKIVELIDGE